MVLPPDSEVVAPFALNGGQLGTCALIVPSRDLTEEFEVVVGHTLVDASGSSANVLMINPNAEEVVLPCKTCIGKLVPISAVSVAPVRIAITNRWGSVTARIFGRHCKGVASFVGRDRSSIAVRVAPSLCTCISGAGRTGDRTN